MSDLTSFVGWYFLPNLVTGWLQTALYAVFIRAGDPKPAPGSTRFVRDRRRIQVFVILAYLLYTIVEVDYKLREAGDFYQVLGVPLNVDERSLQSRFRRLTVQHHPDKASAADRPAAEGIYVHLKLARDTLADPARRFAYDRFGPDILSWQQCKTIKDYALTGIKETTVYYVATAVVLVITSMFGYLQSGKFWRFLVMAGIFVIELYAMTRPSFPAVLTRLINPILVTSRLRRPLLPFQLLALLRKIALTFFIALSQLQPLLKRPGTVTTSGNVITPQQLDQLSSLTLATDQELRRILGLEIMQYGDDAASRSALRTSLKDWLVQNTVRNEPAVRNAMERAFERRRQELSTST